MADLSAFGSPDPSPAICPDCRNPMWGGTRARRRCRSYHCPTGLAFLDAERERYKRRQAVRQPPPTPYPGEQGICRMCGESVVKPRRSWCGTRCIQIYNLSRDPRHAQHQLAAFFAGCWECLAPEWNPDGGTHTGLILEVDHIRPLWSLSPAERLELRWWLPFNLQLLCHICHRAKTAREAAERARSRAADPAQLAIEVDA